MSNTANRNGAVNYVSLPNGPLRGEIRVPGDKSISHRAIMLASLAEGCSHISGFLEGEDTLATAAAFAAMGVRIETPSASERIVHGVGLHGLRPPVWAIACGNAGTAMRLLVGLLSGQAFSSVLSGDVSLSRRPMRRVIKPLTQMGAQIVAESGGLPPLRISGGVNMRGIDYHVPVASAQVKSAILLAGLYAHGETQVHELYPTRDYTERMLATLGWPIKFSAGYACLSGGHRLHAHDIDIPTDFSSAAFFLIAATLMPGSNLLVREVGINPRRIGLLAALRLMGADIREENPRELGGEPVADLRVRYAPLRGIDIPIALVPDMIDEFPILFVAAATAQGRSTIRGATELRAKESDRIAVMATGLRALGVMIEETPDGAVIAGGALRGGEVDALGDHRCAMSFAVAGLIASDAVRVRDCANVATSFPGFVTLANQCGFALHIESV